jgi:hypothetical protein
MTTAVILLISGILIGAGISIIWRDARAKRQSAFVSKRDARANAAADPEVEITISHDTHVPTPPAATPAATMAGATAPAADTGEASPPPIAARVGAASRPPVHLPLEQEWASLQPVLVAGVDKVNTVLAPVQLSISATGEPSWSYKNRGYGAYRRLLLDRDSVAWVRLELSPDGRLHASVKAHKEDQVEINATADVAAKGLTAARASDLLAQCLKPAVSHAARRQPDGEKAGEQDWRGIDGLVVAALQAANGALAPAGAHLIPLAPAAWEAELRRYRMTLSVQVYGDDVARMHIDGRPHEMEVAVGVREPQHIDLGRRSRVPVEGMTVHTLAELIASCAWPAIERFRETHRPA